MDLWWNELYLWDMGKEKWLTVQEFADKEGIKLAAAYKRIKEQPAKYPSDKKFGRLVVKA